MTYDDLPAPPDRVGRLLARRKQRPAFEGLGAYLQQMRHRTRLEPREVWSATANMPEVRRYPVRAEDASTSASPMTLTAACAMLGIGIYRWNATAETPGPPRIVVTPLQRMEAGKMRPQPALLARAPKAYCMSPAECAEMLRLYEASLEPVPYILVEEIPSKRTRNRLTGDTKPGRKRKRGAADG